MLISKSSHVFEKGSAVSGMGSPTKVSGCVLMGCIVFSIRIGRRSTFPLFGMWSIGRRRRRGLRREWPMGRAMAEKDLHAIMCSPEVTRICTLGVAQRTARLCKYPSVY